MSDAVHRAFAPQTKAESKYSDYLHKQCEDSKRPVKPTVRGDTLLAEHAVAVLDPHEWVQTAIPEPHEYCEEYCRPLLLSPDGGTVVIKAPTGSGKTTVIIKFIMSFLKNLHVPTEAARRAAKQGVDLAQGKRSTHALLKFMLGDKGLRVLFVSTRVKYAEGISAGLREAGIPVVCYLDVERKRRRGEKQPMLNQPMLMVSAESLHYVNGNYDIIVLDECTSILKQMDSPYHRMRNADWTVLQHVVKQAKWVICADAYIDDRIFRFLNYLRKQQVQYVHNTVQKQLGYSASEVNQFKLVELMKFAYEQGCNFHFVATVQSFLTDVLEPMLQQLGCPPERYLMYHSKSTNDVSKLENINATCLGLTPEEYAEYKVHEDGGFVTPQRQQQLQSIIQQKGLRVFAHTTTICQGIDITVKHFHYRFAYADAQTVDIEDFMQMIGRVRFLLSKQMALYVRTLRYRLPVTEPEILRGIATGDFVGVTAQLAYLTEEVHDLPDGTHERRTVPSLPNDIAIMNVKYTNISRNTYRYRLWASLAERGYTCHPECVEITDEQKASLKEFREAHRNARSEAELDALESALILEGEEFAELEGKCDHGSATPEEIVTFAKSRFFKHLANEHWDDVNRDLLKRGVKDLMKLVTCKMYLTESKSAIARRDFWRQKSGSKSKSQAAQMLVVEHVCLLLGFTNFMDRTTVVHSDKVMELLPEWKKLHAVATPLFGLKGQAPTELKYITRMLTTILSEAVNVHLEGTRCRDRNPLYYLYTLQAVDEWDSLIGMMKDSDIERVDETYTTPDGRKHHLASVWRTPSGTEFSERPADVKISTQKAVQMIDFTMRLDPNYESKLPGMPQPDPTHVLTFGSKHLGETVQHVIDTDPDYCKHFLPQAGYCDSSKTFIATCRAHFWGKTLDAQTLKQRIADQVQAFLKPPKKSRLIIRKSPAPLTGEEQLPMPVEPNAEGVFAAPQWYRHSHIRYGTPALMDKDKLDDQTIVVQRHLQYRSFARFWNWRHLQHCSDKVNRLRTTSYRCFLETIFGYLPQKPYFDLDIKLGTLDVFTKERAEEAVLAVRQAIMEVAPQIKVIDILLFSSHYPSGRKYSFHIVVDRWKVAGNNSNRAFFEAVMAKVPSEFRPAVDPNLYKAPIQQFRMLDSHKYGELNVKKVDPASEWRGENVFQAALVQQTEGCQMLTGFDASSNMTKPRPALEGSDVSEQQAYAALNQLPDRDCYEIAKVRGPRIELKRVAPSVCRACTEKDGQTHSHENDNPFLFVGPTGSVAFFCRRYCHDNGECTRLGHERRLLRTSIGSVTPEADVTPTRLEPEQLIEGLPIQMLPGSVPSGLTTH